MLEAVLKKLQAIAQERKEARIQEKLVGLREQVYALLVVKYQELMDTDPEAMFKQVDVTGWPQDVIFYHKSCWSEVDCLKLLEAMSEIRFVFVAVYFRLTPEGFSELHATIKTFFSIYFKSEEIVWSRVKKLVPSLHLSHSDYRNWNSKDAEMIGAVVKYFEELKTLKL